LADANERGDFRIFQDFANVLIPIARRLYRDEALALDLEQTICALDSTTIDLCLSVFPWAYFRKTKAAVKMHTLLDIRGAIPALITVTTGKLHDVNVLDEVPLEPDSVVTMDRAYVDFARLHAIHRLAAFFVVRAKRNLRFRRIDSVPADGARLVREQPVAHRFAIGENRPSADFQTAGRSFESCTARDRAGEPLPEFPIMTDRIRVTEDIGLEPRELEWHFVRASGPGGQKVNKTATAVQLRFDAAASPSLSAEVRNRVLRLAGQRATRDGVVVIDARRFRTQARNRRDALERLVALVREAAEPRRPRQRGEPPATTRRHRLEAKRRRGRLKRLRAHVAALDV
jgi:hypothetical protein